MAYVKATDFAAKDSLLTGNPAKIVKGTEIDTEFTAIQAADAQNVKGPSSVTADTLALFDSTTGKLLKASSKTLPTGDIIGTTDSQTLTNKVMAAATNTIEARSGPDSSAFSFRNKIINGDFSVGQRGTSFALAASYSYGPDRWAILQSASANGICNVVASGLTSFRYAAKLGRNSGAVTTGICFIQQCFETANSIDLAGKVATISFYAKAGANFSATTNLFKVLVGTGTGTDESNVNSFGSWTGQATPLDTTQAITTTWTRYSFNVSIGSTATQISVRLGYIPTGTAGADDNVYITGVQLESGSVATPFESRPYGVELALCQRYLPSVLSTSVISPVGTGLMSSTTAAQIVVPFKVNSRVPPTGLVALTASQFTVQTDIGRACSALTFSYADTDCAWISGTTASATAGSGALLYANNASAKILFDGCEL